MNESIQDRVHAIKQELVDNKEKALVFFCKNAFTKLFDIYKKEFQTLFDKHPELECLFFNCSKYKGNFLVDGEMGVNQFYGEDISYFRGALRDLLTEEAQQEYDKVHNLFEAQMEANLLIKSIDKSLLELCTMTCTKSTTVTITRNKKITLKHE